MSSKRNFTDNPEPSLPLFDGLDKPNEQDIQLTEMDDFRIYDKPLTDLEKIHQSNREHVDKGVKD